MCLHFNLKEMFILCVGLMLWHAVAPMTLGIAVVTLSVFSVYYIYQKKLTTFDLVFIGSFIINLWYMLNSWGNMRQYDYFNFYMHADYFLENNFFIAQPSLYLSKAYFQPPLWGGIAAIICKMMMFLGKTKELGFDFVRFISLFAISGTSIVFFRILLYFRFEKILSLFIFALFCFMPIHAVMSNLVNNDALVYFLMLCGIYLALLWYDNNTWTRTLQLGGVLLLAGMTKFSGLMIVPAIAVLGIFKLVKSPCSQHLNVLLQGGVIFCGVVSGFAWGIFLLYHGLPIVPPPQSVDYQNLASYTLFDRLFAFDLWLEPFVDVQQGFVEPNVWLALIKTSLFGEWPWQGLLWVNVIYVFGLILALLLIWSFFILFKQKLGGNFVFNMAWVVLVFAVFAAWINFWLDYPYFCSSEFRYVIILLPVSLCWLALYLSQKSLSKRHYLLLAGLLIVFVFARIMLYLNTI